MDILNCIMGSDNRILKLEPSFLNKMQIGLWISIINYGYQWLFMDVHNYRVYALLAFHSDSYICIGVAWLINCMVLVSDKAMNTTIHYLKMNEWMNEYIFSSRKDWSDPQQIRLTLALIHTSRSWYHNRRTYVDKIYPRETLCKCDRDL